VNEDERRALVENHEYVFKGWKVRAAGWKNPGEASIPFPLGGSYAVTWETLAAVVRAQKERDEPYPIIPTGRAWPIRSPWLGFSEQYAEELGLKVEANE